MKPSQVVHCENSHLTSSIATADAYEYYDVVGRVWWTKEAEFSDDVFQAICRDASQVAAMKPYTDVTDAGIRHL